MKKLIIFIFWLLSVNLFAVDGIIIKTTDYSFTDRWYKTLSETAPRINQVNSVFKKQYFYIRVSLPIDQFSIKNDEANISASLKIITPNNTEYFYQDNLPIYSGKVINKKAFFLSTFFLKICFEKEDEFGEYKIKVILKDNISNKTKKLNSKILLQELPSYKSFTVKSNEDLDDWLSYYYKNQEPEKALSYFLYYTKSDLLNNESAFFPIFSFFLEIFKNNSFLYPQLFDCLKSETGNTKKLLLYLIAHLEVDQNKFINKLSDENKKYYLSRKNFLHPNAYSKIEQPLQLDCLWGEFTANGSYKPILKLIQTLDYVKYSGELEKIKNKEHLTKKEEEKALLNGIYLSLVWSLKSNCEQHSLVKKYCQWAYQFEKLNKTQKEELKKILSDVK